MSTVVLITQCPGNFPWKVPAGVTSVTFEVWGGGGSGAGHSSGNAPGGGGGGYSKITLTVTPGQTVYLNVGAGGLGIANPGVVGGDTWINITTNAEPSSATNGCYATGGAGGNSGTQAGGGGYLGSPNYTGGSGGDHTGGGGGGGGSAGNGTNGTAGNGGSPPPGSGGSAGSPDGGLGGNGQVSGNASYGLNPGGGGGGAWTGGGFGGHGGSGQIKITYSGTTPSSLGNNNFSTDSDCVAVWDFESGSLTTDSISTNTLTPSNTSMSPDTLNVRQGLASAAISNGNQQYFSIADGSLASGFPMKSGDTTKKISVCCWFRFTGSQTGLCILGKDQYSSGGGVAVYIGSGLSLQIDWNNTSVISSASLSPNQWYHAGIVIDGVNKTVSVRVWDDTNQVIMNGGNDYTYSPSTVMSINSNPFMLGAWQDEATQYHALNGNIDEVVVVKDLLTDAEIDAIRGGTYGPQGQTHTLSLSDSFSLGDSPAKKLGKVSADSFTLADAIISSLNNIHYLTLNDAFTLADNFSRVVHFIRTHSDSVTLSDTIIKKLGKKISNTLSLSDSFAKKPYKTLADILHLSDVIILPPVTHFEVADFYLTLRPKNQKISHIWKTNVQTTIKGVEQRSMLYTWPRLKIQADFIANSTQKINYFKRNLIVNSDKIWGIPIWADETKLTSQALSGQAVLNVGDTGNRHFFQGRCCIIIDPNPFNFLNYEVKTIQSLTSTQITLTGNLVSTWPTNALVLPVYNCRIAQDQTIDGQFINIQNFSLIAEEAFETLRSFSYAPPSSGADTYQGLDLFLYKGQDPLKFTYKRAYDTAQFLGLGYSYSRYDTGENTLGLKGTLLRKTRQDIWSLLNFFDSKQGRLERFWIPTRSQDIVVTAPILATDTVLTIEPIQYTTYFLPDEILGRYVFIQFPDRSYVCKKITGADSSTITLDSAIGKAVSAENLERLLISFLILGRFDIDELEIAYIMENYGSADLSFAGLVGETL